MRTRFITLAGVALALLGAWDATISAGRDDAAARDGWTPEEVRVLSAMRISAMPPAPADPSNAVDQSPAAAALGKRLFNDTRFSRNGAVSCASCHSADKQFQDGLPVGKGVATGSRRSMPIVGAGQGAWLFWDGGKDSVWSQALGPLEDSVEHASNRTRIARLVAANYPLEYEKIFGRLPDLSGLPQDAAPNGDANEKLAWESLTTARRADVSRVFANMGKAIAAYEKTLHYGEARFDEYVRVLASRAARAPQVVTPAEVNGLRIFMGKGQCVTCHNGPLFTDQAFHNTGVPQRDLTRPDRGRSAALAKVKQDEFNCLGPFSDAKPEACAELTFLSTSSKELEGAFKTPSLRNVSLRPPYMHGGQFANTEEVIRHYVKAPAATVGHTELAHGEAGHTQRKPIQL
ncbi:MAG: cytochrome-c peroxidase, partial [Ramlibacter sp.]|nr:cytochrome-c peroxidase [Ramlibacter sp.]